MAPIKTGVHRSRIAGTDRVGAPDLKFNPEDPSAVFNDKIDI